MTSEIGVARGRLDRSDEFLVGAENARESGFRHAEAAQLGQAAVAAGLALDALDAADDHVAQLAARNTELRELAAFGPHPVTDAELEEMRRICGDLRARAAAAVAGTAP